MKERVRKLIERSRQNDTSEEIRTPKEIKSLSENRVKHLGSSIRDTGASAKKMLNWRNDLGIDALKERLEERITNIEMQAIEDRQVFIELSYSRFAPKSDERRNQAAGRIEEGASHVQEIYRLLEKGNSQAIRKYLEYEYGQFSDAEDGDRRGNPRKRQKEHVEEAMRGTRPAPSVKLLWSRWQIRGLGHSPPPPPPGMSTDLPHQFSDAEGDLDCPPPKTESYKVALGKLFMNEGKPLPQDPFPSRLHPLEQGHGKKSSFYRR